MGLGDCTKCVKYLLFVFNVIFCLVGLAILAAGIVLYVSPNLFREVLDVEFFNRLLQVSAIVVIVLGSIITVLGFLGCCGAIFENRVLLVLFFILLLIVFLVVLALGIVLTVFTEKYNKHVVRDYFAEARGKPANSTEGMVVDSYQKLMVCCGWKDESYDHHAGSSSTSPPPSSCHLNNTSEIVTCSQRIEALERHRVPVIAAIFITAAISLLGVIFSMILCCAITDLA